MSLLCAALQKGSAVKWTALQLLLFILSPPLHGRGCRFSAAAPASCSPWEAHLCTSSPPVRKCKLEPHGVRRGREAREENCISFSRFSFKWKLEAQLIKALLWPHTYGGKSRRRSRRWVVVSPSDRFSVCLSLCLRTHGVNPHILKTRAPLSSPAVWSHFSFGPQSFLCILAQSHAVGSLYCIGMTFAAVIKTFVLLSSPKSLGVPFSHQAACLLHSLPTTCGLSTTTCRTRPG